MHISLQYSKITTLILSCLLFATSFSVAFASDYLVTPLAINLDVNKRDIISESITLINNDSHLVRLYASVNEVSTNGEGVVESFQSPSSADRTNTPTTWVEISRQRIELKPGETREIPFTIRMNPNTVPGDYSVYIGFAEASNAPQANAKVMEGKVPGTLLGLSIDKDQNIFLRLEKYVVDRFVTGEQGGSLSYTLSNPGRVDTVPKGEVIFYDNNGDEVAAVPLNMENKVVSADSAASFTADIPSDLGLGKYKAFLSVEYGEHLTASVHDTAFFYILPLKQLIAIFIILMIFATFIALYVHRRYDVSDEQFSYESVPMFIRDGRSEDQHHDIDLKKDGT